MAWISLSKLALFITALVCIIQGAYGSTHRNGLTGLKFPFAVFLSIFAFATSLLWTEVDLHFALDMLIKHAKLLQLILLVYLIRTHSEAKLAIKFFVIGQIIVLISSWLLAMGIPLFWVTNDQSNIKTQYVVFSESYLDQSIMLAVLAAIVWHSHVEWRWNRWLAIAIATSALLNVLLLLPGRTGYLASFAVLGLALFWHIPKRLRAASIGIASLLLVVIIVAGSGRVLDRFSKVAQEAQSYSQNGDTATSSGWRLNAWKRSIEAMAQKPWTGYGVGSWAPAVKRLDGESAIQNFGSSNYSNPHQEYLLWGVELGAGGVLLLASLFLLMVADSRSFDTSSRRALQSTIAVSAMACLFNSTLFDALIGDYICTALGLLLAVGQQQRLASTAL